MKITGAPEAGVTARRLWFILQTTARTGCFDNAESYRKSQEAPEVTGL